jgi:signal transduction histidine kinase
MIRTTAEYILQQERTVPEYQQLVGQILVESETTTDLISKLLALARADGQGPSAVDEPLDLREIAAEVATPFRIVAMRGGLNFTAELSDKPLIVQADRRQIRSLMLIILDNAVQYTPPGGTVTLRAVGSEPNVASVEIQDSGIGISEEDLPHIFERFYRADKARSPGDGVGLGLSIAQSIADRLGATIKASSVLGRGSTFRVKFPLDGQPSVPPTTVRPDDC